MTIQEFVRLHNKMRPNSHYYFSPKTLEWFGESLEDMTVSQESVRTHSGKILNCYAISRMQRKHPDGPKRTTVYFDMATMREVKGTPVK